MAGGAVVAGGAVDVCSAGLFSSLFLKAALSRDLRLSKAPSAVQRVS